MKKYTLPSLPYAYNALEPVISAEIMTLHHTKHHQAYVNGANAALERLEKQRKGENPENVRGILRDLSFNLSGHKLHSVFWPNMAPSGKGGGKPGGRIADQISRDFGDFESFKKQFSDAAKNVEAVGWAVLTYDAESDALIIYQVEKQNFMHPPELPMLLTLDVWEHAYYLQYKNDRAAYVDNWWNVVNWDDVEKRFSKVKI
ncbi:MAG: superoxide dismutase [Candidatus Caldarchaeum sp.]|nr:superoxide dismutase [Candidatus Caldarchaeum sp.]MDW7977322.1 superoxide dismutase [Candidatus Caldarchaeum sp.]MDW8360374.1 superoxide dismutase [Candidatus Caldarchaeum sp.]